MPPEDKIGAVWQHHIARPCQINPAARIYELRSAAAGNI